ncbi:MAG: 50S ribosomal protein L15 [Bdellovibrionales bacterium]|nr:50S ribosomal protein L15 [Bdellovibrionales bacterium]
MSKLSLLKPAFGSTKRAKLLGRGRGSGKGQTSGKGGKGQKARKGAPIRRGFEGGQTPIARRNPKFGFSNEAFRISYDIVNLMQLSKFSAEVNPETLAKSGFVGKNSKVKILANGSIDKALNVKAHKFSEKAKLAIEAAGGKVEVI